MTASGVPAASDREGLGPVDVDHRHGFGKRVLTYIRLTKPRVIELLLVTTVPSMFLAAKGVPDLWQMLIVLIGGALAAGGANTINAYVDRDIDQHMARTHGRPLPTGAVTPNNALWFGIILNVIAFVVLTAVVNLLSALLTLSATLFYVFVYTIWLKRRTVQNIVIGGAAGAVPVLVGWAAVTDSVGAAAWVMFAIIFFWTPPHFWALALRYREDYARAGVPMLPVVAGTAETVRQMILYSIAVVSCSLLLIPVGHMGLAYIISAVTLGAWFLWATVRLRKDADPQKAIKLFTASNTYLSALFVMIAVDAVLVN
ncbi:MAG: heme o synthase [Acidimicrobiia bacterium]|nr:heme o synthase [Acidimicrobiia bacterium]MBP8180441.1 heme o synthase [Acidimicrobiia bacterium]